MDFLMGMIFCIIQLPGVPKHTMLAFHIWISHEPAIVCFTFQDIFKIVLRVLFLLAIVLSVHLRFTESDYPFGIFKLFLTCNVMKSWWLRKYVSFFFYLTPLSAIDWLYNVTVSFIGRGNPSTHRKRIYRKSMILITHNYSCRHYTSPCLDYFGNENFS